MAEWDNPGTGRATTCSILFSCEIEFSTAACLTYQIETDLHPQGLTRFCSFGQVISIAELSGCAAAARPQFGSRRHEPPPYDNGC